MGKLKRILLKAFILFVALNFASGCGFGPYFTDDGLRLVHDKRTGKYIGTLEGESKVWDKNKAKYVVTYKVTRQGGSVIELPQEQVTLSKP